jgi:hypothetical protein
MKLWKQTEPLPLPKVTPPVEIIIDALKMIPGFHDSNMLRASL